MSSIWISLQITSAPDDEELREVLVSDDVLDVLSEVGYTGVPQRETKASVSNIIK
jgi:hypothetical protein